MRAHADQLADFRTLAALKPPAVTRAIASLLLFTLLVVGGVLIFAPWVQTASGAGEVTALDPAGRVQNINALVGGRIEKWFVTDGMLVHAGDPIAKLVDNDPQLVDRLSAERDQVRAQIAADEHALQTAMLDVRRQGALHKEGLAARREFEQATIKAAEYRSKLSVSRGALNRIEVSLARQSAQIVTAPRDGRILRVNAGEAATVVKQGDTLATFAPEDSERIIELYVDGRDAPLIHPGRRVRLEFEGWPAIQASGWPAVAIGIFQGRVRSVDVAASPNKLFRLLVQQDPDAPRPWPGQPYVRLGTKVRGWVLMDTVSVGYELWRQLNGFPLNYGPVATEKLDYKAKPRK